MTKHTLRRERKQLRNEGRQTARRQLLDRIARVQRRREVFAARNLEELTRGLA